jgi:hypothetical protein
MTAREKVELHIERMIELLDTLDGDPDLEPIICGGIEWNRAGRPHRVEDDREAGDVLDEASRTSGTMNKTYKFKAPEVSWVYSPGLLGNTATAPPATCREGLSCFQSGPASTISCPHDGHRNSGGCLLGGTATMIATGRPAR